jgi:hypothetical protein
MYYIEPNSNFATIMVVATFYLGLIMYCIVREPLLLLFAMRNIRLCLPINPILNLVVGRHNLSPFSLLITRS